MGGDRELVMFSGLLAFALVFSAQELRATVYGICYGSARSVCLPADGKGRSQDAVCLSAASSIQGVLPGPQHAVPNKPDQPGETVPMIEAITLHCRRPRGTCCVVILFLSLDWQATKIEIKQTSLQRCRRSRPAQLRCRWWMMA